MGADESRSGSGFPSTHWTKVYLASNHEQEAGSRALAELLKTYRPALHKHLRYRFDGIPAEDIDDWISSFIQKKVLEQHLLRNARKEKGKFRNYVLTALDRFAEDQRRSQSRLKRRPAGGLLSYEDVHEQSVHAGNSEPDPGDVRWAMQVIERARDRTETFYRQKGRAQAWMAFLEGCYQPLYQGEARPSDAELAQRHGFKSAREVSNTIINGKRRFGVLLREVVREYVASDDDVDEEIRELVAIVSDGG